MTIPISILCESQTDKRSVETEALIDCGAGGIFMDQNYARLHGFKTTNLDRPLLVKNVDGTMNKRGTIRSFVETEITIHGRTEQTQFYLTGLGRQKIILGLPWLMKHNPDINWQLATLKWRNEPTDTRTPTTITTDRPSLNKKLMAQVCRKYLGRPPITPPRKESDLPKPEPTPVTDTTEPEPELDISLLVSFISDEPIQDEEIFINGAMTTSTKLAIQDKKPDIPVKEHIPPEFHDYLDIFDDKTADRFPISRPWDHAIEMKPGFEPKSFKTYNLTLAEQLELDKFLKENLEKGYICPSQSPMASSFFFVAKKDGKL